jgi:hypothetical protein
MPIERALAREKAFFERHPAYRLYAARCGTAYLTRVLSHMLMSAVKAWLPQVASRRRLLCRFWFSGGLPVVQVRSDVSLMSQSAEQALRELGEPVDAANGPLQARAESHDRYP